MPSLQVTAALRIPLHPKEAERLASVCGLCAPEPGHDALLDRFAREAAALFHAPMGLVTLIAEESQFDVGAEGLEPGQTPREESICAHTILQDGVLVVEDIPKDPRFARLPAVAGPPFLRFYAGAPIPDVGGLPLGSLCAVDTEPRRPSSAALMALGRMARRVGVVFETRRLVRDLLGSRGDSYRLDDALARADALLASLAEG